MSQPCLQSTHNLQEILQLFLFQAILISGNPFQELKTDYSTALPAETSVSFATEVESRSTMPTDDQALMALQDLLSDDFQSKKSNSLQRN